MSRLTLSRRRRRVGKPLPAAQGYAKLRTLQTQSTLRQRTVQYFKIAGKTVAIALRLNRVQYGIRSFGIRRV